MQKKSELQAYMPHLAVGTQYSLFWFLCSNNITKTLEVLIDLTEKHIYGWKILFHPQKKSKLFPIKLTPSCQTFQNKVLYSPPPLSPHAPTFIYPGP